MAGEPRAEDDQKVHRKLKKEKREKKEKKKHKKEKKERKESREHKKRKHKHRRHAEAEIKDERVRPKKKRVQAELEKPEEDSAGAQSEPQYEEDMQEEEVKAAVKHAEEDFPLEEEESLAPPEPEERPKHEKKRDAKLQQALLQGGHEQVLDMRTSEILARQLINSINEAIIKDNDLNKNDKLALNKLTFAKQMVQELKKVHIQEEFLRMGGLETLGRWISKMPDGNYPCYNVLEVGLECLQFLPITTEYLRESKVGANVKRLARDTKSDKLKRACTAIIEKWYRMIFNLDNGYDPDGAYEEQYRAYLHEK